MPEYYQAYDSIECRGVCLDIRALIPSIMQNVEGVGSCWTYKAERNGTAEIKKELNPKRALHKTDSHLDIGDSVTGEKLSVLIEGSKVHCKAKPATHRHKSQQTEVSREFVFAEITKPITHIANGIAKRKAQGISGHSQSAISS